ncbi:MAG: DUF302 domain-containing protein [Sorangiineae bacterium]|nr:DUF302 domain-containing protein [Sorangiineae bacterium]
MNVQNMGIRRELPMSFDEALAKVPEALKAEGFGILTEIDVKETMKKKLDVEFARYRILGACNPPAAHKVLSAEPEIGLLLPCNVIVYDQNGKTVVSAFNPLHISAFIDKPEIKAVAEEIAAKLTRVVESL